MKRYIAFTIAAALAAGITNSAWSQGGQGGGGGTSGGTSGSGTAGTGGTTGSAGTSGTAGTAGTAGTSGTAGTTGTAGRANAAGRAQVGAGQSQVGANAQAQGQFGAQAQNFGTPNRSPFFSDRGARQQLNLNDNQFNQLNRAYQDAYGRYSQAINNLDQNLTQQQRQQRMQQLQARFNQDFNSRLDSTLTDPQLRQRYNQLYWQHQGPNAFANAEIQQQLNMTADQQQQIRELSMNWQRQLQQLRRGDGTNVTAEQWNQLRTQYQNQLGTILTPQQQQTWSQMIGQRYNFPVGSYLPIEGEGRRVVRDPRAREQPHQQGRQQGTQRATAPNQGRGTVR